ncbi:MAG: hypothetical protein ACTSQP_03155 [Promethearchaeota archaeon]
MSLKYIILDEKWHKDVFEIGEKFNYYVKKGSLRMISFLIDKAFNILSDDNNPAQYDAAYLLKRIRAVNPKLISPYISVLLDAKIEKALLESDEYIVPNYIKYPHSSNEKSGTIPDTADSQKQESSSKENGKELEEFDSDLLSWDFSELLKFNIIKNLKKITYSEIDSPIKKCACGDGVFEKDDKNLWQCTECKTAYHENCAKIVAIMEGKCRICECSFTYDDNQDNKQNIINQNSKNEN